MLRKNTVKSLLQFQKYNTIQRSLRTIRFYATYNHKKELVILGSGWGGFRVLRDISFDYYNVSLVSPRNHFVFTPLLASASVGTLEFRSIVESNRRARIHPSYQYYMASAEKIDVDKKQVICKSVFQGDEPFTLSYDKLVIAVGCDVNTMGVKGATEHAHFLKELHHARHIRSAIIECFERANEPNTPVALREALLRFVIVGGGPTGIEAAAEINDFITQDLRHLFPDIWFDAKIYVLEAGTKVLSQFDEDLREFCVRWFKRNRITIRTGCAVQEVTENSVILEDGSVIQCGFVLWSAGIQPRKVLLDPHCSPGIPKDTKSRVIVDENLQVKGIPDVYALGDASVCEKQPLLATAQVAQQQGKYLAKKLNHEGATGKPYDKPFVYEHFGMLAYIGSYKAIAEMKNMKLRGWISWFVWRSAYLTKLVSIKNKILVPFDWLKAIIFGRDVTKF